MSTSLFRVLLLSLVVLGAQDDGVLAQAAEDCTAVADDARRLACYDARYRPATVETTSQAWSVRTETSPVDDTANVYVESRATAPITDRFGQSHYPSMVLRCQENTTAVSIYFGGLFMAGIQGYGEIIFRVDDKPAFNRTFEESTSNEHLGLWSGGRAIPFIRTLFGGTALLVRATPFNENPTTFTLPIAGLEEAVKPLREACHW